MLRFASLALVAGCSAPAEEIDVVYDTRHGNAGLLDIYLPEPTATPQPTIMFIHGGSWKGGDKQHFRNAGSRLARSGFVAASINYRLVPDGVFPNNINDCICALAFLRGHAAEYGIDPDRIVVMGYSAGAHLASLVALASTHPELAPDCDAAVGQSLARPAAAIPASGPQDLRTFWREAGDKSLAESIVGGSLTELPHIYDLASPTFHVGPGAPPFLIMQDAVDFGGIADFRSALVDAGNQARLLQIEGSLHILEQGDDAGFYEAGVASETPEAWIAIEDFLFSTVGGPR